MCKQEEIDSFWVVSKTARLEETLTGMIPKYHNYNYNYNYSSVLCGQASQHENYKNRNQKYSKK